MPSRSLAELAARMTVRTSRGPHGSIPTASSCEGVIPISSQLAASPPSSQDLLHATSNRHGMGRDAILYALEQEIMKSDSADKAKLRLSEAQRLHNQAKQAVIEAEAAMREAIEFAVDEADTAYERPIIRLGKSVLR